MQPWTASKIIEASLEGPRYLALMNSEPLKVRYEIMDLHISVLLIFQARKLSQMKQNVPADKLFNCSEEEIKLSYFHITFLLMGPDCYGNHLEFGILCLLFLRRG